MKKILIIGANSDMGKSFARDCAEKGSDLILTGRDEVRLEQLANDLKIRNNIKIEIMLFDIRNRDQVISFYDSLPSKPDVVACFIGILAETKECTNDFEIAKNIININFTYIILVLDQIANAFEHEKNGIIVCISSTAGDRGRASRYHYGSAKSGLNTYLSGLRQRLHKSNVRVINIKPGFCNTKMIKDIDTHEFLTSKPEDISKAIFRAIKYNLDVVYVYWFWKWIMLIVKLIPEFIFKRLNIK